VRDFIPGLTGVVSRFLSATGDDDLIAQAMESFCQSAADARSAAGNKDGVVRGFHDRLKW